MYIRKNLSTNLVKHLIFLCILCINPCVHIQTGCSTAIHFVNSSEICSLFCCFSTPLVFWHLFITYIGHRLPHLNNNRDGRLNSGECCSLIVFLICFIKTGQANSVPQPLFCQVSLEYLNSHIFNFSDSWHFLFTFPLVIYLLMCTVIFPIFLLIYKSYR